MAKRQEMPDLPDSVFAAAKTAWARAVRKYEFTRGGKASHEELAELKEFLGAVDAAYMRLSEGARWRLNPPLSGDDYAKLLPDPDDDFALRDLDGFKEPPIVEVFLKNLRETVEELTFVEKLELSGALQIGHSGANLVGLRAFALVLKEFWLSDPMGKRKWRDGGGSALARERERYFSPAEQFLYRHAREYEPLVTMENARTVIRRPSRGR